MSTKLVGMYVVHEVRHRQTMSAPSIRFATLGRVVETVEPDCVLVRQLDANGSDDIDTLGGSRRLVRIEHMADPSWTFYRDRESAAAFARGAAP